MDETTRQRNIRFSRMVAALPKRTQVIGEMSDGTVLTVEVPSFTAEQDDK